MKFRNVFLLNILIFLLHQNYFSLVGEDDSLTTLLESVLAVLWSAECCVRFRKRYILFVIAQAVFSISYWCDSGEFHY